MCLANREQSSTEWLVLKHMQNHATVLYLVISIVAAFKPGHNTDTPSCYKAYFSRAYVIQCGLVFKHTHHVTV